MDRREDGNGFAARPAVTLSLAKRPGANAVVVAEHVLETVETLRGTLIRPALAAGDGGER